MWVVGGDSLNSSIHKCSQSRQTYAVEAEVQFTDIICWMWMLVFGTSPLLEPETFVFSPHSSLQQSNSNIYNWSIASSRSLPWARFFVAMENFMFRPAHQAAQCVCHTLTHAQKIIGVWKIQSYWISSTFWHFHLKGHSWLSVRICDAAGERNYSDSKTMQGRNTAPNHTSRSVLLSFVVLVPLTLLVWWVVGVGPLRGRTWVPSLLI